MNLEKLIHLIPIIGTISITKFSYGWEIKSSEFSVSNTVLEDASKELIEYYHNKAHALIKEVSKP